MAHNTGPPMCKVCGVAHRWQDDHVWMVPAESKKTGGGDKKEPIPAAVAGKTARIKAERLAVEAAIPKPEIVKIPRVEVEKMIAAEAARKAKQRERVKKFRSKRAAFRHQGR